MSKLQFQVAPSAVVREKKLVKEPENNEPSKTEDSPYLSVDLSQQLQAIDEQLLDCYQKQKNIKKRQQETPPSPVSSDRKQSNMDIHYSDEEIDFDREIDMLDKVSAKNRPTYDPPSLSEYNIILDDNYGAIITKQLEQSLRRQDSIEKLTQEMERSFTVDFRDNY
eukprot:Platyproteum_vivax@DN5357_c0_g1_i1.p1